MSHHLEIEKYLFKLMNEGQEFLKLNNAEDDPNSKIDVSKNLQLNYHNIPKKTVSLNNDELIKGKKNTLFTMYVNEKLKKGSLYITDFQEKYSAFFHLCEGNKDLEIFGKFFDENKIDVNIVSVNGNNGFLTACTHNPNLDIIKFLVKKNSKVNIKNKFGDNAFTASCWKNPNVEVIKYIVETLKFDINVMDNYGMNGLMAACSSNKNVKIVEYLIDEVKMDISVLHKDMNLLELAGKNNNDEVYSFLKKRINSKKFQNLKKSCF